MKTGSYCSPSTTQTPTLLPLTHNSTSFPPSPQNSASRSGKQPKLAHVACSSRSGNHSRRDLLPPPRPQHSLAHFFVNREARTVFLEHYERIFTYINSDKPRGRGGGVYINLSQDSLCVASGLKGVRYLLHRFPEDMLKIRYLDINVDSHAMHAGRLFKWNKRELLLPALTELKLVTLRWLTFSATVRRRNAFRGNFADTLEVLHRVLRHRHARKVC